MSQKFDGWLFDLYYNQDGKISLWIKRKDGSCIKLVEDWSPSIYVAGAEEDLGRLTQRLYMKRWEFTEKFVKLDDPEPSRVLRIYTRNMNDSGELANYLLSLSAGNRKYDIYNVDLSEARSFLYERDIFPLAFLEAETTNGKVNIRLKDSPERLDYELPPLKTVSLDVNITRKGRLVGFNDEFNWVRIKSNNYTIQIDSGSEAEKLQKLVACVKELDPDIILTEDGDSFLFPYLTRRALVNGILNDFVLSRENIPLSVRQRPGRSYWSYNRIYYRPSSIRLLGRLHLDVKNGLLVDDCGLEGLVEVARTCRIPLHEASRGTIGSSMTSIQLYQAFKDGYLIPWRKAEPEGLKSARELIIADRGGFYYEPIVGVHDHVGEIDFSSLYPTLMLKKNLSAETVRCNCCPDSTLRVPELDYNICQKRLGIVPKSLELLLKKKAHYKRMKKQASDQKLREVYNRRQAALKWILVCCLSYDSIMPVLVNEQLRIVKIGELVDAIVGDEAGIFYCNENIYVVGVGEDLRIKYSRIKRLIKTRVSERMFDIFMDNGRRLCTTSSHEFYVLKRGRLYVRKANQLKVGDLIPVCKTIPDPPKIITEVNLIEALLNKLDSSEMDEWRVKGEGLKPVIWQKRKLLCQMGLPYTNVRSWYKSGIIPLRYLQMLSFPIGKHCELIIGRGRSKGGRIAWLPSIIPVDRNLGFFLGLFIADGSARKNFLRIDISQDESELLRYLRKAVWKLFRLRPHIYKEKRAKMYVAQINCVTLVQVLRRVLEVGGSADKGKLTVPTCILNANPATILGFISGLIAGDGSVHNTRNLVSIATASEDFLKVLSYLLLRVGFQHSLRKSPRKPSDLYRLDIVGSTSFIQLIQTGFVKKKHEQRLIAMANETCTQDCHHISYELIPVIQTNMRKLARRFRTVRDPRVDILDRTCPTRASRMLHKLRAKNAHELYPSVYNFIEKVVSADVGFVSVREIKEVQPPSNFVYCFEIEDALPGFFAGNGAVFTHNSFGYLGYRNARFGKIDAHIATCAFSREVLQKATHLAEENGFYLVHGIVDGLWLKKPRATEADFQELCSLIQKSLDLPIELEGIYRWVVFLPSKIRPNVPVLNRYYGVFHDGQIKVRGLAIRRHDTPRFIKRCMEEMLQEMAKAETPVDLQTRRENVLAILYKYIEMLRGTQIAVEDLIIQKVLSKPLSKYKHNVLQALAARQLSTEGLKLEAGEAVSYIITNDRCRNRSHVTPASLMESDFEYDVNEYTRLLLNSISTMLAPLGWTSEHFNEHDGFRKLVRQADRSQQRIRVDNYIGKGQNL